MKRKETRQARHTLKKSGMQKFLHVAGELGIIALILAVSSLIGLLFFALGFSDANIITIFILGVLMTAIFTTRRLYGVIASLMGVLLFNYLFTEPRFTLHAYNPEYPFTFLVMLLASLMTSSLTAKIKLQAIRESQKARQTEILLETSQLLQQSETLSEIMTHTLAQMNRLLNRPVQFIPVDNAFSGTHAHHVSVPDTDGERLLSLMRESGSDQVLQEKDGLVLPVRGNNRLWGLVRVGGGGVDKLEVVEKNLLISMLGECTLALEKNEATLTRNRMEVEAKQEQLRANLLRAISHDLRTPLTSISGNASLLLDSTERLSGDKKTSLLTDIREDADWLKAVVENLLSATRVENGTLGLKREPELVMEVMTEAVRHFSRLPVANRFMIQVEQDLLLAWMDSRLILQVFINLLDNASTYVPDETPILMEARQAGDWVEIRVSDQGPGIPDEKKKDVFDMFVRLDREMIPAGADRRRGLGLGLYLCRIILQAHGGRIWVEDNQSGGATFCFTLPAKERVHDQTENTGGGG